MADTTPTDTSETLEITVLATGFHQPVDEAGQAVSVLGADEIARAQGSDITRLVERFPGLSLDRNGPVGASTGVFVRGASSQQLLVLIDGVPVADLAAPSGGFDFGGLTGGGIGRIELLRGSNSVVWGSDAIGGVMAITTREINGVEANMEGGSHGTADGDVSLGMARDAYAVSLTSGFYVTDGIPAEPGVVNGDIPNGFRQWHLAGRGRLRLADGLDLVVSGRYADSRVEIDSYGLPPLYTVGNYGDTQSTRQGSAHAGLEYDGGGALSLRAGLSYADTARAYVDPLTGSMAPNYTTDGQLWRVEGSGHLRLPARFTLDFGADTSWSRFVDTYDAPASTTQSSGHALLGWHGGRLELSGGMRVDSHSLFGTHWTSGANGSFRLGGDVRVRASWGEGFKAPTLYQLLSPDYGTPSLRPESSKGWDVALEKGSRGGRLHLAATWFHRDTSNLIDFVDCYTLVLPGCVAQPYGYYLNIGRVRAEGLELEADGKLTDRLTLSANYSHIVSTDETPGSATLGLNLAHRPRDVANLSADWRSPWHELALGLDLRASGTSWDDAANTIRLAPYAVVDARASLPLPGRVELFGRIENLGNAHYSTAAGYAAYGRSGYVGLRVKM